jgi:hypothetical protein
MNSTRNLTITLVVLLTLLLILVAGYYYRQASVEPNGSPSPTAITSSQPTNTPSAVPTATGAAGIEITQPLSLSTISSPLVIKGKATGSWFFEAQFRVKLLDEGGNTIGQGTAHADGEWMTELPVPFTATLTFSTPSTSRGTLVFENDNPSGLPQNIKSYRVPVTF